LFEFVKDSYNVYQQLEDIHDEVYRRVLQTADVIGLIPMSSILFRLDYKNVTNGETRRN
jgi:hypothetical protein